MEIQVRKQIQSIPVEMEIVSSTGQVIYNSIEQINEGSNEFKMDQSHLSKGLYMITLKNSEDGVFETIRFMKK